jgi:hypothetical protein
MAQRQWTAFVAFMLLMCYVGAGMASAGVPEQPPPALEPADTAALHAAPPALAAGVFCMVCLHHCIAVCRQ